MPIMVIYLIFSFIFVSFSAVHNRTQDIASGECSKIEDKLPPVYLLLDQKVQGKQEARKILKNNQTCAIRLQTKGFQVVKLQDGKVTISRADDLEDGSTAEVQYQVYDNLSAIIIRKPDYDWGHSVFLPQLGSGKSTLFSIEKKYLDPRYRLSVVYENVHKGYREREEGIEQRVYYLPKLMGNSRK
jgi:hypothetical protein